MTPNAAGTGLRQIEEFANSVSFFHKRHPAINLIICVFFIVAAVSFPKYSFAEIIPLALYPLAIFYFTEIPVKPILKKLLSVMPLIIGIGIFNPFFDKNMVSIGGLSFSLGWISFASLVLRGFLCSLTALLTVSVLGVDGLTVALSFLRVPKMFITQSTLTLRYLQILLDEAGNISLAYSLRSDKGKAPGIRQWGVLAGAWLLRSLKRADRIYNAMLLKGYSGENTYQYGIPELADVVYMLLCSCYFVSVRYISIPNVINTFF